MCVCVFRPHLAPTGLPPPGLPCQSCPSPGLSPRFAPTRVASVAFSGLPAARVAPTRVAPARVAAELGLPLAGLPRQGCPRQGDIAVSRLPSSGCPVTVPRLLTSPTQELCTFSATALPDHLVLLARWRGFVVPLYEVLFSCRAGLQVPYGPQMLEGPCQSSLVNYLPGFPISSRPRQGPARVAPENKRTFYTKKPRLAPSRVARARDQALPEKPLRQWVAGPSALGPRNSAI